MSCKGQEMPTLGILGMTAHKIGKLAQTMYAEYDLNKSQSMILFQLHRDGRISAHCNLCLPDSSDSPASRTGTEAECKCTFDHIDDPEDGEVGIYREEC